MSTATGNTYNPYAYQAPPRCKDLGTVTNANELEEFLDNHGRGTGSFIDLELGDIITLKQNDYHVCKFYIAGFDWCNGSLLTWMPGIGYAAVPQHSICLFNISGFGTGYMNSPNTKYYQNNYYQSDLRKSNLGPGYGFCEYFSKYTIGSSTVNHTNFCIRQRNIPSNGTTVGNSMYGKNTVGYESGEGFNIDYNSSLAFYTNMGKALGELPSEMDIFGTKTISSSGEASSGDTFGQMPFLKNYSLYYYDITRNKLSMSGNYYQFWLRDLTYYNSTVANFGTVKYTKYYSSGDYYGGSFTKSHCDIVISPCSSSWAIRPIIFLKF